MSIVKPTQKAVKDFASDREDIKKKVLSSIEIESREIVDVDIESLIIND